LAGLQGAEEAGDRIATLDVFKNAKKVKVDPDKPLQQARYVTLKVKTSSNMLHLISGSLDVACRNVI